MKQIEAQAIISAVDRTGTVFEAIAGRVRGLTSAMKALGGGAGTNGIPQTLGRIDSGYRNLSHAILGTVAAQKALGAAHKVVETYKEYDDIIRYQRAITGMSEAQQAPFIQQAIKLGGSTPFNDIKVLHAQLDLIQRGVDKNFIIPMTAMGADYAQAMNADLGESTKTIEGILFSTRKHIEDGNEALKVAQRAVDYAVKLAKIGGLDNEDIKQLYKYGGMSASMAGFSDPTFGALAASMRRSNIRGDEAGIAIRAISGALVAPTQKGQAALLAMGIDYSKFTKEPVPLNVGRMAMLMKQTYGRELTPEMSSRLGVIFGNQEIVGDRGEFIAQTFSVLSDLFPRDKKGRLPAQDANRLTKSIGTFHKLSVESVDTEGLLRAIMEAGPSLPLVNALFTSKQGARAMAALGNPEQFNKFAEELNATPEGFAHKIAIERMAGFSGAVQRTEGALMNLWTALGRANDPFLTAGFDRIAKFVQSVAELDTATLRQITVIGGVTTGLVALNAALSVFRVVGNLANPGGPSAIPAGAAAAGGLARWMPWLGATLSIATTPDLISKSKFQPVWDEALRSARERNDGGRIDLNVKVEAPPSSKVTVSSGQRRYPHPFGSFVGTTGSTGKSMPEASASGGGEGW